MRVALLPVAILALFLAAPAAAQDDDDDDGPGKPVTEIIINARRLDAARANILPGLGAASYALGNDTIESRPGGETTTIGQILLQAPGVSRDASGGVRVRQSPGGLEYRINNVILPPGLTDPGESLSPRVAAKVELLTGALPAQYGANAGGVVNVTTKDGVYLNGGQAELYGGGPGEIEPAFEFGNSSGNTNFFVTASMLHSHLGLPSPDGSATPLHDHTRQYEGLAYLDRVIGARTRLALVLGLSDERFQVPNLRGLDAASAAIGPLPFLRPLSLSGVTHFASEDRDASRHETSRYAVLSVQHSTERFTVQLAGFVHGSAESRIADGTGELLFTGLARSSRDTAHSAGLQLEGVYELSPGHTLRAGGLLMSDIRRSHAMTTALPVDAAGAQVAGPPLSSVEDSRVVQRQGSLFLQDEWRLSQAVTVNLGARLDHFSGTRALTRLSPRLNLVWQPAAETKFHIGYARYVMPAPVAEEASDGLGGTSARLPSPAGQAPLPEFDHYFDLGVQHDAGALTASLGVYWREARNLIDNGTFGPAGTPVAFNYGRARLRGVELALTYNAGPASAWLNLAVAGARARTIASSQAWFTAAELAMAAQGWLHPSGTEAVTLSGGASRRFGPLRIAADLLYGSGVPRTSAGGAANGAHLPGHVEFGISGVWRAATIRRHPLDLRLDVINLFDRGYSLADGTALGGRERQWGPRRGIFVGLEQAF